MARTSDIDAETSSLVSVFCVCFLNLQMLYTTNEYPQCMFSWRNKEYIYLLSGAIALSRNPDKSAPYLFVSVWKYHNVYYDKF